MFFGQIGLYFRGNVKTTKNNEEKSEQSEKSQNDAAKKSGKITSFDIDSSAASGPSVVEPKHSDGNYLYYRRPYTHY